MNLSENQFQEIEAYLLNDLDNDAKQAFKHRLESDNVLSKEVNIHSKLVQAIEECALEDEIGLLFDELESQEKIKPFVPPATAKTSQASKVVTFQPSARRYMIAAAVVLLMVMAAGLLLLNGPDQLSPTMAQTEEVEQDVESETKQVEIQSEAFASINPNQTNTEPVWMYPEGNSVVLSSNKPEENATTSNQMKVFSANNRFGVAPFEVLFESSLENVASYSWNFGDGNQALSATPSHVYTEAGKYSITLIITDKQGKKDTLSIPDFITVLPSSNNE